MGSFANQLFSWLLGWLQSTVSLVWSAFTAPRNNSLLSWIGEHWMLLALILCLAGTAADLTVYLFRWRPARVWASFFRRIRHHREAHRLPQITETEVNNTSDPVFDRVAEEAAEAQARRLEEIAEEERRALARRENAEAALRRNRRRRFVTENGERISGSSAPPQLLFDTREAYRAPVYPRKWKDQHESQPPYADE